MNKWIAEFELEDGDKMPEHMDLEYKGAKIDFHCRPLEQEPRKITLEDLTTNQCIKGLYAIKIVLESAMGENYPEQTKNQLTCLDHAINELETLLTANTQLKKQIEMLKLDRDCCAFTLEELDLLEQCLSKYVYSITGFPKIAMSCAEKIERLKGDFE